MFNFFAQPNFPLKSTGIFKMLKFLWLGYPAEQVPSFILTIKQISLEIA